jgi:hypothetical protein
MRESGSNDRSEEILRSGVYRPPRGPLARLIALLILILLVLIPIVLFVLSMFAKDRPPSDGAGRPPAAPAAAGLPR